MDKFVDDYRCGGKAYHAYQMCILEEDIDVPFFE
jgi:hypothetical protein